MILKKREARLLLRQAIQVLHVRIVVQGLGNNRALLNAFKNPNGFSLFDTDVRGTGSKVKDEEF